MGGIMEDQSNQKRISKLIRVQTSKSDGQFISFEDYVSGMKEWQNDIFFIAGPDEKELKKSPFMEKFNEKDVEVIYFTEPADEYMVQHLREFDGNKFMTKFYGTKVMSVSISKRLGSVPAIVSSSAYGQSANMERIMRAQAFAHNQNKGAFMEGMRTMEINPR